MVRVGERRKSLLTEKCNEINSLGDGEKGERVFPTFSIYYTLSSLSLEGVAHLVHLLTFPRNPLIYLAFLGENPGERPFTTLTGAPPSNRFLGALSHFLDCLTALDFGAARC